MSRASGALGRQECNSFTEASSHCADRTLLHRPPRSARQNPAFRGYTDTMTAEFRTPLKLAVDACTSSAPEDRLSRAVAFRLLLDELDYYQLLGMMWSKASYLWPVLRDLKQDLAMAGNEAKFAMMSEAEAAMWELLPETFDVYRGCYWENTDGLAWSREPEVAAEFPFMEGNWREASPLLAHGVVQKRDCIVKLCGERVDILSTEVGALDVEQLAPQTH